MEDSGHTTHGVGSIHEKENHILDKPDVAAVKVIKGDTAYSQAYLKEPPKKFSGAAMTLYAISVIGFFCSTSNGFDSSLFGNLLANKTFKAFFNVQNDGIWAGIVTSMSQIGGVVALPFIGPATDTWGRR